MVVKPRIPKGGRLRPRKGRIEDIEYKRHPARRSELWWNALPDEGYILIAKRAATKLVKALGPIPWNCAAVAPPVAVYLCREEAELALCQLRHGERKEYKIRKVLVEILPERRLHIRKGK